MSQSIQFIAGALITISFVLVTSYVIARRYGPRVRRWVATIGGGLSPVPVAVWVLTSEQDRSMALVGAIVGSIVTWFLPARKDGTQVR